MIQVDWDKYREYDRNLGNVEKKVIQELFNNYVNPMHNSCFLEKSRGEIELCFNTFLAGWILANMEM
jgi:hypothetical protein